ncbi:MAG TPA: HD domain-containing phosphohydrolase, partial [Thermoanaerobaculia bacterium]|nr:HD domain-containing phosphohydrolase [Thermoanaerobaculia bacterium]
MRDSWSARLVRLALGLGVGGVAKLLGAVAQGYPIFGLLGTTSIGFVTASVLFGWPGLAGAALVHFAYAILRGSTVSYLVVSTLAYAGAGALVYLAFRGTPRTGRSLTDLRSVQVYLAATGLGGLATSGVITAVFESGYFWRDAGVWARATVVSVWVFGPPLLMAGWWFLRPWLVPLPGEVEPDARRRFGLTGAGAGPEPAQVVARPEPRLRQSLLIGAALILGVGMVSILAGRVIEEAGYWLNLLYLFPLYWAARRHRLGGGLVAAAGIGLVFMVIRSFAWAVSPWEPGVGLTQELEIYAHLLLFLAIGILLGAARDRESRLLEELAESNRRLRLDLQRVVRALTGAVEAKDLYTEGHLHRVSVYAREVGRRLGLGEHELELLQIASALHDIGKIAVPEAILNKPGCLASDEREVVERHPETGARILENVEGLEAAAPLVRHHQERFDGRRDGEFPGYPQGIAGETIP